MHDVQGLKGKRQKQTHTLTNFNQFFSLIKILEVEAANALRTSKNRKANVLS